MSYEWAVQNEGPEAEWYDGPEIVVVAKGAHDCSRLIHALRHGNNEQAELGARIAASMNRRPLGRRVTLLLKRHGGEDLTEMATEPRPDGWWERTIMNALDGFDSNQLVTQAEADRLATYLAEHLPEPFPAITNHGPGLEH